MNDVGIDMNHFEGSKETQFESFASSSKNLYIPHVSDDHKPKLGQEFLSLDEVKEFYNAYAKKAGFSVRINSNAQSRRTYHFFGDVVIFDTTYNTNIYGMIFAPFIGVNHHGQSIIFGCAFLSDETTESFVWLFEQFLKVMPDGPPKMIITDQDPTITKAIAETFPNTVHRYCIWHITSTFSEKSNGVLYSNHYNDFKQCIWDSHSTKEFELKWMEAVGRSGMTSSQRLESCHAFFKRSSGSANDDIGSSDPYDSISTPKKGTTVGIKATSFLGPFHNNGLVGL
ncbi:hypothetical protein Ddye_007630 [Dipteronia dyeriana]|uniref:MULE transposase domain-containing protein n=1 Tax=Dipteronia dyeriana TaxID=168575 RepID=A0AAD9XKX3_9ROSI|nr:hypothetical protein Ddye_007630 [Dipteronia dyeriana]